MHFCGEIDHEGSFSEGRTKRKIRERPRECNSCVDRYVKGTRKEEGEEETERERESRIKISVRPANNVEILGLISSACTVEIFVNICINKNIKHAC